MHQRKPTNHKLRHCYCVDWPRQNAQPPASPHKGCFQLNTQYYWHKKLRAQKMYLVCLPGFCFSSLSTAILCENECRVAPVTGNQRLESEKKITYQRLHAKGWHQSWWLLLSFWIYHQEPELMKDVNLTKPISPCSENWMYIWKHHWSISPQLVEALRLCWHMPGFWGYWCGREELSSKKTANPYVVLFYPLNHLPHI